MNDDREPVVPLSTGAATARLLGVSELSRGIPECVVAVSAQSAQRKKKFHS